MPTLIWSDALSVGVAPMDATHQEFIALLAEAEAASDADLLPRWQALVMHTQAHFDAEDRYMRDTRFFAENCHTTHHKAVLDVLRHGLARGQAGDLAPIRQMTRELATWFVHHADTMDAALAGHLQRVGYDPATGQIAYPEHLPPQAIAGCDGSDRTPQTDITATSSATA
ncbi:MAG: hemerythrin domain-containing protein [Comamonadaceae bacterium]|nr:hemerythrin domain-containing protein [Comamonadaceae bacterium]